MLGTIFKYRKNGLVVRVQRHLYFPYCDSLSKWTTFFKRLAKYMKGRIALKLLLHSKRRFSRTSHEGPRISDERCCNKGCPKGCYSRHICRYAKSQTTEKHARNKLETRFKNQQSLLFHATYRSTVCRMKRSIIGEINLKDSSLVVGLMPDVSESGQSALTTTGLPSHFKFHNQASNSSNAKTLVRMGVMPQNKQFASAVHAVYRLDYSWITYTTVTRNK
jgi:hypothetical protein